MKSKTRMNLVQASFLALPKESLVRQSQNNSLQMLESTPNFLLTTFCMCFMIPVSALE